ncbi:MAG: hypothetical protein OXG15_05660 [Gammaproteobacteria bacterium]|nr:hypothetical protein [Gammaproteobacteria bacterium]
MMTETSGRKIGVGERVAKPLGIGVVGVGGGGGNIVSHLSKRGIKNVDFYAINTDRQALDELDAGLETIQIGARICDGAGAGGDPEVGRSAAQEDTQLLMSKFERKRLLFIVSCMGGGTGTGASPVIANHASHENPGLLTISILTTPGGGIGDQTVALASDGIREMRDEVDALMVVPNNRPGIGMRKRHREVNELVYEKINAIARLLVDTQVPNIDLADLKATLSKLDGEAVNMFIGTASLEPDEMQHEVSESRDSQARFKGLLAQALDTDWLTIDFGAPIEEGRGVLSFTLGGDEDDEDIDDITDESSIKQSVEEMQTGAKTSNLKVASFVDDKLPKGAMVATVVLRAAQSEYEAAVDEIEEDVVTRSSTDYDDESPFDPLSLPTEKELVDLTESADDFEKVIDDQDDASPQGSSLDFTANEDASTELTRKNPS